MVANSVNIVLDTNILISSLVYGGKPERVVRLVTEKEISAVISPILKAELIEVLLKKFKFSQEKIASTEELIEQSFWLVNPTIEIHMLKDEDDNRVLEAAITGQCRYIVTGDKELLALKTFRKIRIVTSEQFLSKI